jgi:hypothetical protein
MPESSPDLITYEPDGVWRGVITQRDRSRRRFTLRLRLDYFNMGELNEVKIRFPDLAQPLALASQNITDNIVSITDGEVSDLLPMTICLGMVITFRPETIRFNRVTYNRRNFEIMMLCYKSKGHA